MQGDDAWRRDCVRARMAERCVSGGGEGRGVNPIQGSLILRHPRNTGHRVRAIFTVRVRHAYVGDNCPRFPGLERSNRLQYPTRDDVVEERIDIAGKSFAMPEWQIIVHAVNEPVGHIEISGTFLLPRITLIAPEPARTGLC